MDVNPSCGVAEAPILPALLGNRYISDAHVLVVVHGRESQRRHPYVFSLHRPLVVTRPGGGVIGGVPSLGGATEHQGYGTPHLHANVHVASTYRFDTLVETMRKLKEQKFSHRRLVRISCMVSC